MGKYIILEENGNSFSTIYKERFESIVDAERYESNYIYGLTRYYEVIDENDKVIRLKEVNC